MQMNRANNDTIIVYEEQLVGHFYIKRDLRHTKRVYITSYGHYFRRVMLFISSKAAAKNNDSYLNYMNNK